MPYYTRTLHAIHTNRRAIGHPLLEISGGCGLVRGETD